MSERKNSNDSSEGNVGAYILGGIAGVAVGVLGLYGVAKLFDTPPSNEVLDRPHQTTDDRRYGYQRSWYNPPHRYTTNRNYTNTNYDSVNDFSQVTVRPQQTTDMRADVWEDLTHQHTSNSNYTDTDSDCAICLKKMKPVKELPCKHKFHDHCITTWIGQKPVCPKCNAGIH